MGPIFPIRREMVGQTVRHFTDALGQEWSVCDVENPTPENGIPSWYLCFERGIDRRRLTPIPGDWKECGAAKLDEYREKAKPVHRAFASPDQFSARRR